MVHVLLFSGFTLVFVDFEHISQLFTCTCICIVFYSNRWKR